MKEMFWKNYNCILCITFGEKIRKGNGENKTKIKLILSKFNGKNRYKLECNGKFEFK
jgi:hypothetical protein